MLPLLTLKGNDNALPFVALATMGDGGIALCCLGNAGNVGQWFGVQLLPNVVAWRFIPPSSSSKPVHCLELDHLLFLNHIIFRQGRQCPSNGAGMLHSRELQPAHQRALRRKSKFTTSHITTSQQLMNYLF